MMVSALWRHEAVIGEASARLLATTSGWQAYTFDDTALLKQGDQSVGVSHQYAGCIGGLANCQSLITLGVAQEHVSAPLATSLYLPPRWDDDAKRRARFHVPADVRSHPKWKIGQELLLALEAEGLLPLPVLGDSPYGDVTEFPRCFARETSLVRRQGQHDAHGLGRGHDVSPTALGAGRRTPRRAPATDHPEQAASDRRVRRHLGGSPVDPGRMATRESRRAAGALRRGAGPTSVGVGSGVHPEDLLRRGVAAAPLARG